MVKNLAQDYHFSSLKAVDLGCGDMTIGSQISGLFQSYLGVDIVEPLIEHNKTRSFDGDVSFQKINIIEENLPEGDICFIRQVLQHLSNEQISKILEKLKAFKYVVVTEHLPSPHPELKKNLDKPHGGGFVSTRIPVSIWMPLPSMSKEAMKEYWRFLIQAYKI